MLQLNRAKFSANGSCGYVLKPQCMCHGKAQGLGQAPAGPQESGGGCLPLGQQRPQHGRKLEVHGQNLSARALVGRSPVQAGRFAEPPPVNLVFCLVCSCTRGLSHDSALSAPSGSCWTVSLQSSRLRSLSLTSPASRLPVTPLMTLPTPGHGPQGSLLEGAACSLRPGVWQASLEAVPLCLTLSLRRLQPQL